jgi:hypothetical protein
MKVIASHGVGDLVLSADGEWMVRRRNTAAKVTGSPLDTSSSAQPSAPARPPNHIDMPLRGNRLGSRARSALLSDDSFEAGSRS